MNNAFNDKKGRYEISTVKIRTVDQAVVDYFDRKLQLTVDAGEDIRKKVPVIFASPERWKAIDEDKGFRDENGTLILPLISIRRTDISREKGFGGMGIETSYITVTKRQNPKTPMFQSLQEQRRTNGFPKAKESQQVLDILTIPFPDFCQFTYEITIWTQYQNQMNDILEKIFYNFDYSDSFVMPVTYEGVGKSTQGNKGYYFVGFRDGDFLSQSNLEEFTDSERLIRYSYAIRVPVYLILSPDDEALAYGRDKGSDTSNNAPLVYQQQTSVDIQLTEKDAKLSDIEKKST